MAKILAEDIDEESEDGGGSSSTHGPSPADRLSRSRAWGERAVKAQRKSVGKEESCDWTVVDVLGIEYGELRRRPLYVERRADDPTSNDPRGSRTGYEEVLLWN